MQYYLTQTSSDPYPIDRRCHKCHLSEKYFKIDMIWCSCRLTMFHVYVLVFHIIFNALLIHKSLIL